MTLRNQHHQPEDLFFFGDHLFLTEKTLKISVKTFFLEITSLFGQNCGIFSVRFGLHKTGNPSYLSWPLAHVRLPAALLMLTIPFSKTTRMQESFYTRLLKPGPLFPTSSKFPPSLCFNLILSSSF